MNNGKLNKSPKSVVYIDLVTPDLALVTVIKKRKMSLFFRN
ncbi:hypothetical protein Barb6XT_03215 [Bacteroidales bacterium Barb6XT]|nr:hypothetical protein Barb6XT_03215 [Bacteroidales bacterium Barb6XT]